MRIYDLISALHFHFLSNCAINLSEITETALQLSEIFDLYELFWESAGKME